MTNNISESESGKALNLADLIALVWRGKWIIIGATVLFAVLSFFYAVAQEDIYRSEAELAPAEDVQSQGFSGMSSQLGGLASLAGVQMGQGKVDNATLAVEILRSRKFIQDFVERRNILPDLMAVDYWDPESGTLHYNEDIYNPTSKEWVRQVNRPYKTVPESWEYVPVFRQHLEIQRNDLTGLTSIAVTHRSPDVAKNWVDWLVEDINQQLRARDIREATQSIEYLEQELDKTSLASMQQVFYGLIERETQSVMMANVRPEYVFRVIDPATRPALRYAPNRKLILIVGTFLGGVLGVFIVAFISVVRAYRSERLLSSRVAESLN